MNIDHSKNSAFGDKYFLYVNSPTARSSSLIKWDNRFKTTPLLSSLSALFTIFQKCIIIPAMSCYNPNLIKSNHYFNYIKTQEISKCCILLIPIIGDIIVYFLDKDLNALSAKLKSYTFNDYDKIAIKDAVKSIPQKEREGFVNFVLKFYSIDKFNKFNAAELASFMEFLKEIPEKERQSYSYFSKIFIESIFADLNSAKTYIEAIKEIPLNQREALAKDLIDYEQSAGKPKPDVEKFISNSFGLNNKNENEKKELLSNFVFALIGDKKSNDFVPNTLGFIDLLKQIPQPEHAAFYTLLPVIDTLDGIQRKSAFIKNLIKIDTNERENIANYTVKLIDGEMMKSNLQEITNLLINLNSAKERSSFVEMACKFKEHWRSNDALKYMIETYKTALGSKSQFVDITFNLLKWASKCTADGIDDKYIAIIIEIVAKTKDFDLRKNYAEDLKIRIKAIRFDKEKVNQAYKLFARPSTCTDQELNAVLRKQSLTLHPDKTR